MDKRYFAMVATAIASHTEEMTLPARMTAGDLAEAGAGLHPSLIGRILYNRRQELNAELQVHGLVALHYRLGGNYMWLTVDALPKGLMHVASGLFHWT